MNIIKIDHIQFGTTKIINYIADSENHEFIIWFYNCFWGIFNWFYDMINWFNGLFNWFYENGEFKFRCFTLIIALVAVIINTILGRHVLYSKKDKYNKYLYRNEASKALSIVIALILLGCSLKGIIKDDSFLGMFKATGTSYASIIAIILYVLCLLQKVIFYRKVSDVNKGILGFLLNASYVIIFISALNQFHAVIIPFSLTFTIININAMSKSVVNNSDLKGVDLYETRKRRLVELNEMINEENNYAIVLNGEWGSGKSEFFKGYMKKYKDDNYYIYIKPMMTDTRESLINQFRKSLIGIMKEEGRYVGKNSTANKYFQEVLKLFKLDTKISLDSFIGEEEEKTYMDLKKEVEQDIKNLIKRSSPKKKLKEIEQNVKDSTEESSGKKKLIVIIDDFDRIDEDGQEVILHFIKEIIDFKGCIVLFALDYNNIKKNSKIDRTYLEKFVKGEMLLAPIDFEEIIRFHEKEILSLEKVTNEVCKDKIHEIKNNIYEYYNEMEERIYNYIEACEETTKEVNDNKNNNETKNENKNKNNNINKNNNETKNINNYKKLNTYFKEKRKRLNNSRRVIHFLNAIQSTIQQIDKIYIEGTIKLQLLKDINAGEIIYFFNFLKVFDNEIYDEIINSGGVDEYISDIKNQIENSVNTSEDKKISLKYFELMLGEIIINENKAITPKTQLKRRNQLRFFNDIFIDCNLTKDNIALINNVDNFLDMLRDRQIGHELGEFGFDRVATLDGLKVVLNEIYEQSSSEDEIRHTSENFARYLLKRVNYGTLKLSEIMDILTEVKNRNNLKYFKYILEPIKSILYSNIKISYLEKNKIKGKLRSLENNNAIEYKPIFEQYLILLNMDNNVFLLNDENVDLKNVNSIGSLQSIIATWTLKNDLMNESTKKDIYSKSNDIIKLIEAIETVIYKNKYKIIDINLMKNQMNEFKANHILFSELGDMIENRSVDFDQERYVEMAGSFKGYFADEDIDILKDLSERREFSDEMIFCFENLMTSLINSHRDNIDNNIRAYCKKIYNNMSYLKDKNIKFYLSISLILEALLHVSEVKVDEEAK